MTTVWLVAILSLTLPSEDQLRSNRTESFPLPGPPGMKTSEEFRSWVAPGGRTLTFFYWTPYPRDFGPMAIVSQFPARVAGQDTRIIGRPCSWARSNGCWWRISASRIRKRAR